MAVLTDPKTSSIQVIARAASILRLLGKHSAGLSLSALAQEAGLARSTVQRIVQALQVEGFVESSGPQGGFRLGPTLGQLVYRHQIDIVDAARPFLQSLCAELNETVALSGLVGLQVTTVDRCIAERTLRVMFPLGSLPNPPQDSAPGLAILSTFPEQRVRQLLGPTLSASALDALLEELARIRATGRARNTGTIVPELSGFAVPLHSSFGVHAIAAILPTARSEGKAERIFTALETCRLAIESKLGQAEPAAPRV